MLSPDERRRLQDAFEALPKTPHSANMENRHPEIEPEWIIQILENPYAQEEGFNGGGEPLVILFGRVPEFRQWIKVIFLKVGDTAEYHTAYPDRRLEKRFGGRPW